MDKVIDFIHDYHKENRFFYYQNIFFILIIPIINIVLPNQFQNLFDTDNNKSFTGILKIIVLIIILQVVIQLNYLSDSYQYGRITGKTVKVATKNIIKKNMVGQYGDQSISKQMFDVHMLEDIVTNFFYSVKSSIIPLFVFNVFVISYFFYIDKRLGLLTLLFGILNLFIIKKSVNKCGQKAEDFRKVNTEAKMKIEDVISNIDTIQLEDKKIDESQKINKKIEQVIMCKVKHVNCYSIYNIFIIVLFFIYLLVSVYLCYRLKHNNMIKAGTLLTIFFLIKQMVDYQNNTSRFLRTFSTDSPAIKKLSWMLDLDKINKRKKHKLNKIDIKMNKLTFSYPGNNNKIVNNFSYNINHGQKLLIKGKIGSGKSTLVKMLTGRIKPDSGNILINNQPFDKMKDKLQNSLGYMVQNPILFEGTILENIKYSVPNISDKKVTNILKELDVYKTLVKSKEGLNKQVGKNGSKLSGGQRQIIVFVRMYLKNPKLIILDEPTSSLDENTVKMLERLLIKFTKDKTVIIISHEDFMINRVDKILDFSKLNN